MTPPPPEAAGPPRTRVPDQAIREVAGLLGICLIAYGAWLIFPPAGFIAGGALLVALAALGTLSQRPKARPRSVAPPMEGVDP